MVKRIEKNFKNSSIMYFVFNSHENKGYYVNITFYGHAVQTDACVLLRFQKYLLLIIQFLCKKNR